LRIDRKQSEISNPQSAIHNNIICIFDSPIGKLNILSELHFNLKKMQKKFSVVFKNLIIILLLTGHSYQVSSQVKSTKIYITGINPDVDYLGSGASEKMDIYYPSDGGKDEKFPAILMIHGGGWVGGDKAAKREKEIGGYFSSHGYVCASINYTIAGDKPTFPLNVQQCKRAVKYMKVNAKKLQIDSERIGVIGGSAGGHLALMVAYTADQEYFKPLDYHPEISDRVQAVVDMYGPTDLLTREKSDSTGVPTGVRNDGSTVKYIGYTREQRPDLWKKASPVNYITPDDPPTLILHGLKDNTVDYHQSMELDTILGKAGKMHELILIEDAGHTFTLKNHSGGKPMKRDLSPVVLEFFDKWLKK
jgi:acetyl esterase/lipase